MFQRIATLFEMIKVVELAFQSAFAVLDAIGSIENTGFRTL
jgi:hypothetical protein